MTFSFANSALRLLAPHRPHQIEPLPPVPERRTCPDAIMDVMLRFETERGPRTVIAPGLSLLQAREIADAMIQAGHYAELVDHAPAFTVAEHIVRRNSNLVPKRLPRPTPPAAREVVLDMMKRMA